MKSKRMAFGLWLISGFGCLGLHRFYLGKVKTAVLWFFSGGLLGIGALIDLFTIGEQVRQINIRLILEKLAEGEDISKYEYLLENKAHPIDKNTYCPYCKEYLYPLPKHDFKCPFCHKEIYYLPDQKLFDTVLLSDEDAAVWKRLNSSKNIGITEADFVQKRRELEGKFGNELTGVDVLWNLILNHVIHTQDKLLLKKLYRQLELFLTDIPYDLLYLMKRAMKMQLLELRQDIDIKEVRIITTGLHPCPVCQNMTGRTFTVEEALIQMPLPCKECTRNLSKKIKGFCQCRYQGIERIPSF